jgi:hypothetical protein
MGTAETHWPDTGAFPFPGGLVAGVWLLAVLAYGVGDAVTTVAVVASPLHAEANPVVAGAVAAFGTGGLLALKLAAFSVCSALGLWGGLRDDPFLRYMPPAVLAAVGVTTTAVNLVLLS